VFDSLVVQTAFLGDLLLGIPLFKKIKELHPDGRLTVVCRRGLGSFLTESGLVDEVIEIDKKSGVDWREAKRRLKDRTFDLLLCPHESPRSALFVRGLKAKKKIGFKSWFNGFIFDERIERPMQDPEAIRQLSLLSGESRDVQNQIFDFEKSQQKAGGRFENGALVPVPAQLGMQIPKLVEMRAKKDPQAKTAVLAPGSVWATKMWTSEGFVAVGKNLANKGFRVLISGSAQERALCESIAREIPGAESVAGKTSLFESAKILSQSDLLVCNDSGSMHLASCAGTPTVSVFGPTVLDFGYRPWNDSRAEVVQLDLDCRPCGTHGAKACPLGTHACMKGLPATVVSLAVDRVLNLR